MTEEQIDVLKECRESYTADNDRVIALRPGEFDRLLEERERLLAALQEAANKLLWAGSALSHAWAQERPPEKDAAEEAYEAEEAARKAIAYRGGRGFVVRTQPHSASIFRPAASR